MKHIICPECGAPWRWDELGTHDECPWCRSEVDCTKNAVDVREWQKAKNKWLG